jgi:hypothetical protein
MCLDDCGENVTDLKRVFQRPRGEGWLLLADRPPSLGGEFSGLANFLLTYADLSYQPLCIVANDAEDSDLPQFITDIEILLDRDVGLERLQDAIHWDVLDPGILILAGGNADDWVAALGDTNLGISILQALIEGMLLVVIGGAASALGAWILQPDDRSPSFGLNWLMGALILPWVKDPADSEVIRSILSQDDPLYAIGLVGGRLLALGPEGEVEWWGIEPPTLVLGSRWRT